MARSAGIISSRRLPRVANSCPVWSYSSLHHPTPTPRRTRLPDSTAAVPTDLATVMRSRTGATYTPVVKVRCSVTVASPEKTHMGSGHPVSLSQPGEPSGCWE